MLRPLPALVALLLLGAPAAATAYQERLVHAAPSSRCTLRVEADDQERTLRLRVVPPSCRASREDVAQVLEVAFSRLEGTWRSLFLGRLVEYPWLADQLVAAAAEDGAWDRRRGKPVATGANAYVAAVLSRPEVTAPLDRALRASGYRIAAAIVEKVLVAELREVREHEGPKPPGKLPFDAMVWFRLERRGPAGGP